MVSFKLISNKAHTKNNINIISSDYKTIELKQATHKKNRIPHPRMQAERVLLTHTETAQIKQKEAHGKK